MYTSMKYISKFLFISIAITMYAETTIAGELDIPQPPVFPVIDAPISPKDAHKIMKKRKVAKSTFREKFKNKKERLKPVLKRNK